MRPHLFACFQITNQPMTRVSKKIKNDFKAKEFAYSVLDLFFLLIYLKETFRISFIRRRTKIIFKEHGQLRSQSETSERLQVGKRNEDNHDTFGSTMISIKKPDSACLSAFLSSKSFKTSNRFSK